MKREDLMHLKLQAAIREHNIPESDIKYIGEGEGTYWYRIDGKYSVPVHMIDEFERVDEEE
jgi:hypothetical protein